MYYLRAFILFVNNVIPFSTLNVVFFFLEYGELRSNFRPGFMAQGKNFFTLGRKQLCVWIKNKTFE